MKHLSGKLKIYKTFCKPNHLHRYGLYIDYGQKTFKYEIITKFTQVSELQYSKRARGV